MFISKKKYKDLEERHSRYGKYCVDELKQKDVQIEVLKERLYQASFWVGEALDHLSKVSSLPDDLEVFDLPERNELLEALVGVFKSGVVDRFFDDENILGGGYSGFQLDCWEKKKGFLFEKVGYSFAIESIPRLIDILCSSDWKERLELYRKDIEKDENKC